MKEITIFKSSFDTPLELQEAPAIKAGFPSPAADYQQDLFDYHADQFQKLRQLDKVIDRINRVHGTETIVLGSQQYTRKDGKGKADVFANAIKHDHRSKNPTTRWTDIIKLE